MWAKATACTVHLVNRLPATILDGTVPYEAFTGEKPDVSHFRAFGSTAYVHVHKGGELDVRLSKCILVSYFDD